jgi:hypothetical protein
MNTNTNYIFRHYPYKSLHDTPFKNRFTKHDFEKYDRIIENKENYDRLKKGINFLTNRKIRIGGKVYNNLLKKYFFIKDHVFFTDLDNIDRVRYLQETEKIKNKIQKSYTEIDNIINKINALEKWDSYVEFGGKKYGIPNIYNNIHRTDDCFGKIIKDYVKSCNCEICENWVGCGDSQYFSCEKCNFSFTNYNTYNDNTYMYSYAYKSLSSSLS